MKESQRTSRFVELKNYNIDGKGDDFLEVTRWSNGEGFDLHLSRDHQWLSINRRSPAPPATMITRVTLFLIPTVVIAFILHDHALYFPADYHQPADRADR